MRKKSTDSLKRSRELRSRMSASEEMLWKFLRKKQLGFRFNRQVPIEQYFIDFYCAEAKLAVEVDGEQHQDQLAKDQFRDQKLLDLGIETIRIRSLDLFTEESAELTRAIQAVLVACELRTGKKGQMPS